MTNEENTVSDINISAPIGASDHSYISFNVNCKYKEQPPKIKVRYDRGNYIKMRDELNKIDWVDLFSKNSNDADSQWESFKEIYHNLEREHVPRKNVYVNGKFSKKISHPLDAQNIKKIKKKNRLRGKIRKNLAKEEKKCNLNKYETKSGDLP